MEFQVCDYTRFFEDPAGTAVSPITCKFVIVWFAEKHWLLIGRVDEFSYHAMLVHRFSTSHGLSLHWIKFMEMAELVGDKASILGGGWMKFDFQDKTVRIYGSSTAYGAAEYHLAASALAGHPDFGTFRPTF